MIELYGCGSPNVLKVLLMLEELGLPYRLHKVNVHAAEQYDARFIALNPNSKVPVIVDDDGPDGQPPLTLCESGAILIYLAEKTGRLLPRELATRSIVLQWLMFQMSGVGPMFGQALHFQYIAPKDSDYARRRYLTEVKRLYDVIETRLAVSPWLGGDEFSIADIATYPWAGKYRAYPGFDARPAKFPQLARWVETIEQRPAYQRIHELFAQLFKEGLREQQEADPDALDRFFGRGRYFRV